YGYLNQKEQKFSNVFFAPDYSDVPAPGFRPTTPRWRASTLILNMSPMANCEIDGRKVKWVPINFNGRFDPAGPGDVSFSGTLLITSLGHSYIRAWNLIDTSGWSPFGGGPTVTVSPLPSFGAGTPPNGVWIHVEQAINLPGEESVRVDGAPPPG